MLLIHLLCASALAISVEDPGGGALDLQASIDAAAALLPVDVAAKLAALAEPSAGDLYLSELQGRFEAMLCVPPYQAKALQQRVVGTPEPVSSCYVCASKCKGDCLAYHCVSDADDGASCSVFSEGALTLQELTLDQRLGRSEQEHTLCLSQSAVFAETPRPPAKFQLELVVNRTDEDIGVEYEVHGAVVAVASVAEGGLAAAAGLAAGDAVIFVNGAAVTDRLTLAPGAAAFTVIRTVEQGTAVELEVKPHHLGSVGSDLYAFSWHKAFQFVTGLTSIAATVWGTQIGSSALAPTHNYLAMVLSDIAGVEGAVEQKVDRVMDDLNALSEEVGREMSTLMELISFAHAETQALIPARKLYVRLQTELLNQEVLLAKRGADADEEFDKLWTVLVELHPYVVGGPMGKPLFLVQMEKMATMVTADLGAPALVSALLAMRTTFSSVLLAQLRGVVLLARMLPHASREHRHAYVAHVVHLLDGLAAQKRSCDPAGSPAFQATVAFAFNGFAEKLAAAYVSDIQSLEPSHVGRAASGSLSRAESYAANSAAARAGRTDMSSPAWAQARAAWIGPAVDLEMLANFVKSAVPFVLSKDVLERSKSGFIAALKEVAYSEPTKKEEAAYLVAQQALGRDTAALKARPYVCGQRIDTLTSLVRAAVAGQDATPSARELGSMLCDVERGWITEHVANEAREEVEERTEGDVGAGGGILTDWRRLYSGLVAAAGASAAGSLADAAPRKPVVRTDDQKFDVLLKDQAVLMQKIEGLLEEQEHQTTLQEAIVGHLGIYDRHRRVQR